MQRRDDGRTNVDDEQLSDLQRRAGEEPRPSDDLGPVLAEQSRAVEVALGQTFDSEEPGNEDARRFGSKNPLD